MKFVYYKKGLLLKIIYVITLIYAWFQTSSMMDVVMWLVACILPFVFPVLFKLLKRKMSDEMMVLNITFIYFASLIGSCLNGYKLIGFDKAVHFASGLIAFTLGLLIYEGWTRQRGALIDQLVFCHLFNISVAALWEFYEYFMLVVFDYDCINHYASGVHDCVTDMICAVLGGAVVTLIIWYTHKKQKPNFFQRLVCRFYEDNK